MYSQQLLRVHHDEWLRHAESRRLVKEARAEARETEPSHRRAGTQRVRFGALGLRGPLRHA
jgi:hypothetical protein